MQLRRQRARSNTDAKQEAVDPTGYSQRSKQAQDKMQTAGVANSLQLPETSSASCVVPPAAALLWLHVLLPLAAGLRLPRPRVLVPPAGYRGWGTEALEATPPKAQGLGGTAAWPLGARDGDCDLDWERETVKRIRLGWRCVATSQVGVGLWWAKFTSGAFKAYYFGWAFRVFGYFGTGV